MYTHSMRTISIPECPGSWGYLFHEIPGTLQPKKCLVLPFNYRPSLERGLDQLIMTLYTISIYASVHNQVIRNLFEARPLVHLLQDPTTTTPWSRTRTSTSSSSCSTSMSGINNIQHCNLVPAVPRKLFESADCVILYTLSIYSSVYKQLILTLFESHILY